MEKDFGFAEDRCGIGPGEEAGINGASVIDPYRGDIGASTANIKETSI